MLNKGVPAQDVIEAARKAGKQLVRKGKMEEETLRIVSRELVSLKAFVEKTNLNFERALDRLEKEKA
jgi:hypothetical protein